MLHDEAMVKFLVTLMGASEVKALLRDQHFRVDSTFLQAWALQASLERSDGQDNPQRRFRETAARNTASTGAARPADPTQC
jgi:hypothetical protein